MALSHLFPYGAPELVEGEGARLCRSLFAAAALVAVVVAVGGLAVGRAKAYAMAADDDGPPIIIDLGPLPEVPVAERPATAHQPGTLLPGTFVPSAEVHEHEPLLLTAPALPDAPPGAGERDGIGAHRDPCLCPGESGNGVIGDTLPLGAVVDVMPELLSGAEPRYPEFARETANEGRVRVLMRVGVDGRVREARLAPGVTTSMFDEAALEAARTCRFVPARTNGRAVSVWVAHTYEFRLR